MSYIYIQNLEIRNWLNTSITNSYGGHNHIYFTDIYAHDSGGTGGGSWFLWALNQQDPADLHIYIVDCEMANSGDSGTKWYAGGIRAYNFKTHDNDGAGLRFVSEHDASGKFCLGCVSYGNSRAGFQLRTSDSLLQYFKSYDNGWNGIEIWISNDTYPERQTRGNFTIRDGELFGNYRAGIDVWGMIRNNLYV